MTKNIANQPDLIPIFCAALADFSVLQSAKDVVGDSMMVSNHQLVESWEHVQTLYKDIDDKPHEIKHLWGRLSVLVSSALFCQKMAHANYQTIFKPYS